MRNKSLKIWAIPSTFAKLYVKKIPSWLWLLLEILVLGAILRLVNIGTEPYWGDEVLSLNITRTFSGFSDLFEHIKNVDFHPPLYYLMLRPWINWFGTAEASTRSLSLLFGLGLIVLTFWTAKRLFKSPLAGLSAAFVIAILPMQIEFSQEARPYVIWCFFCGLAAWALWEYWQDRRLRWPAVYILSILLALYLHYSAFLVLGALGSLWLIWVIRKKTDRGKAFQIWLAVHGIILLGFVPLLSTVFWKLFFSDYALAGLDRVSDLLRPTHFFVYLFDDAIWLTKFKELAKPVLALKFAAQLVLLWFFIEAVIRLGGVGFAETETDGPQPDKETVQKKQALFFSSWLFLLPAVFFLFSPQSADVSTLFHRHLIFITLPFAWLIGFLAVSLAWKKLAAALLLLAVSQVWFISKVMADDSRWDNDFSLRNAGYQINKNVHEGDLVVAEAGILRIGLTHYLNQDVKIVDFLPIMYFEPDLWGGRNIFGLVESEYISRITAPSNQESTWKLNELNKKYRPQRIWLYGFPIDNMSVYNWFRENKWKMMANFNGVPRLNLYIAP